MAANQIGRDMHQPRSDLGIASKSISRFVGPHKTFLGQVLRGFPVPDRGQNEPENSRPMELDHRIEVVFCGGAGLLHHWGNLGHRRHLGGQTFLHPPV